MVRSMLPWSRVLLGGSSGCVLWLCVVVVCCGCVLWLCVVAVCCGCVFVVVFVIVCSGCCVG